MFGKREITSLISALAVVSALSVAGCNSSKTNDDGESGKEEQFVSTDSTTGSISLNVLDTSLGIGDTSGFFVTVKDSNGAGVPATRIACDSESGLAIIEPTQGFELTDSSGSMSGRVGCVAPGSFQLACRLPIGANKRKFETIICSGDVPTEFTGFPGAGGGSLGGGVDNSQNEGESEFAVRITSIEFYDGGSLTSPSSSIDLVQSVCDDASAEPFFDTSVGFTVKNNSQEIVRIESYTYTIANFDGAGSSATSARLSFLGETPAIEGEGGEASFTALFLDAEGAGKRIFGRADNLSSTGFRNVTFRLRGTTSSGDVVNITARASASFGTFDRCGG